LTARHTRPATTAHYAHLWTDPLRVATERVGTRPDVSDKAQAKIDAAKRLMNELEAKRPGVKTMLRRTGLSSSATGVAAIVKHAEMLGARAWAQRSREHGRGRGGQPRRSKPT